MNQTSATTAGRPVLGKMFLYEEPQLLTKEEHGGLGLSAVAQPYDLVRSVRALPLVTLEFPAAQRDYPIVFSDAELPSPLAVLGVVDDVNLYVDESGNWERGHYVPSYVRCHPISFAAAPDDQLAVVIDRAAPAISEQPDEPFFDGDKLAEKMQARVDLSARYYYEGKKTKLFCERLKALDLFTAQEVTHRPAGASEERPFGRYTAIDTERLGKLDAETLRALNADGALAAIYAHVFSLQNWNRLLDRRARRGLPMTP